MSKYTLRVFKTDLAGLFRCFVHPETLDRMDDIIEGDYVLIKGNKRTETVLQIKVNEDVPRNCIRGVSFCRVCDTCPDKLFPAADG